MSEVDRDELRRLLAEAAPGPWEVRVRYGLSYIPQVLVSKWVPVPCKDAEGYVAGMKREPDVLFVGQDADVPLIAAAVNALPGLLDALEKAETHRDSLAATLIEVQREKLAVEAARDRYGHAHKACHEQRDAAWAAIERVRELHRPINVEPSDTVCEVCSYRLPNGRFLPTIEYPCPTIQALDGGE